MQKISFTKMVASGNDFIVIDKIKLEYMKLARELCQRKLSIGADGLLLIEPSKKADFKMRIFNPDGSEVDMCGNGARCVALYAAEKRICAGKMVIETRAGNLEAEVKQDPALAHKGWVKLKMGRPKGLRLKFNLDVDGQTQNLNYINTGVPHVVSFLEELDSFNVIAAGKAIRYHSEFQPQGTNADFVRVLDKDHIALRTYERGVEEETLACGTGAVASSIITAYDMQEKPQGRYKFKVDTQSGETLTVYFNIAKDKINDVYLEGKAKITYKGKIGGNNV